MPTFAEIKAARAARQSPIATSTTKFQSMQTVEDSKQQESESGLNGNTNTDNPSSSFQHQVEHFRPVTIPYFKDIPSSPPSLNSQPTPPPLHRIVKSVPAVKENELFELKSKNSIFEIRYNGEKSRSLWANKRIRAGSSIINTVARVAVVGTSHLQDVCSKCFLNIHEISVKRGGEKIKLDRCSRCRVLHYCSKECQVNDWTQHINECQALQVFHKIHTGLFQDVPNQNDNRQSQQACLPWVPNEFIRAIARICWARRMSRQTSGQAGDGKRKNEDPSWWATITGMESHRKRLSETDKIALAARVNVLREFLSAAIPDQVKKGSNEVPKIEPVDLRSFGFESSSEILDLLSAFTVNSFTLSSPSLSPIGVALSPLMAMANHSCDPNAAVVFPSGGAAMRLVALKNIEEDEEITTAYIDLSSPTSIRQTELQERYAFKCDCTVCSSHSSIIAGIDGVEPRWCVFHPGCKAEVKGTARLSIPPSSSITSATEMDPPMTVCDACGIAFVIAIDKLLPLTKACQLILKEEDEGKLGDANLTNSLHRIESLIARLGQYMPMHSYPLLPLCRLMNVLNTPPNSISTLHKLVTNMEIAYEAAVVVYPPSHPVLAIMLAERGKILTMDGPQSPSKSTVVTQVDAEWAEDDIANLRRLNYAIDVLRKAQSACEKSFGGDGGIVGKEMNELRMKVENELRTLTVVKDRRRNINSLLG